MGCLLDVQHMEGLSEAEAARLQKQYGFNELPTSAKRTVFDIMFGVAREPMFLLLVSCGAIYFVLGDLEEALMLLGFVFVVMGITFFQERKTERTLEALRELSSPRALVVRDGRQRRIPGREVVRGDLIVLTEGDRIPADALLLSSSALSVDESLLTGESVPVRKVAAQEGEGMGPPGGDDLPSVFSGTLVVQGQGVALVQATGSSTEIGKIGKALQVMEPEQTPLKIEVSRLVRRLALFGAALCSVIVIVYGLSYGKWLDGLLAGIALAMAVLPEEFPVILTVFLAIGAWRIAKHQVLTRRVPAVEALGAATVLCVDKTGTLTQNRMQLRSVYADGAFWEIVPGGTSPPESFHDLLEYGILASQREPFDPMENAIKEFGRAYLAATEHLHDDWMLVREYPLSRNLLAMSHVWRSPEGGDYVIAAKGAPEVIAELCHFDSMRREELAGRVNRMAEQGLRVLGVARALFRKEELPQGQHDYDFVFLGLLGLADPIRRAVPAAVEECHSAGIRVVMITGDYPGTARSIAEQIGVGPTRRIVTGPELEAMDEATLARAVGEVNIFARMVPEQKLRLVDALKGIGEIVAMTGDGVNDAPALKSAHIGIAMGGRGTDVAREAADLVLLDDDFSSIVQAVRLGRRIFDNLKKAMAYTVAVHIPIAGLSLFPILFGWPLALLPMHIVFLELIIDPACSIVFEMEQEEKDIMQRPPRDPRERLFSRRTLAVCLLQGTAVLLLDLLLFGWALHRGLGGMEARALAFTMLIVANLGLIFSNRSWERGIVGTLRTANRSFWVIASSALLFLMLILYAPFLRNLFRFSLLHPYDLLLCLGGGMFLILCFELFKIASGRVRNHP